MEWRLLDLCMKDGYFIQSVYEAVAKAVNEKKISQYYHPRFTCFPLRVYRGSPGTGKRS